VICDLCDMLSLKNRERTLAVPRTSALIVNCYNHGRNLKFHPNTYSDNARDAVVDRVVYIFLPIGIICLPPLPGAVITSLLIILILKGVPNGSFTVVVGLSGFIIDIRDILNIEEVPYIKEQAVSQTSSGLKALNYLHIRLMSRGQPLRVGE